MKRKIESSNHRWVKTVSLENRPNEIKDKTPFHEFMDELSRKFKCTRTWGPKFDKRVEPVGFTTLMSVLGDTDSSTSDFFVHRPESETMVFRDNEV